MDYSNHRCPVCEKPFTDDNEVVVCPECGAPHHRECYEEIGRCYYEDKHKDGFDYKAEKSTEQSQDTTKNNYYSDTNSRGSDIIACQNCGTFNVSSNDVCNNCGAPLDKSASSHSAYDRHTEERQTPPHAGNHANPQQPFPGFAFDPMGGLKSEDEIAENVTVGEVAKFTKNNSPFFCRLFHQIKTSGRSRLSFVGLFFHGGWLLYRKMYKLGAVITGIMALFIISQLYIETFYADLMKNFTGAMDGMSYASMFDAIGAFYQKLDSEDKLVMCVYALSSIGQLMLRVLCALCGNRWYYKHTIKTIQKAKQTSGTSEHTESVLQSKGGVNTALAVSLVITYYVLTFLPNFF
ncbi:MAG: hypothetical protein IKJ83_04215 [Ruminococcus sp.]|nr:hypothetical protein [Ruminococcus sp.]